MCGAFIDSSLLRAAAGTNIRQQAARCDRANPEHQGRDCQDLCFARSGDLVNRRVAEDMTLEHSQIGAPSEAWRFWQGESPCGVRPNQPLLPSVAAAT